MKERKKKKKRSRAIDRINIRSLTLVKEEVDTE
jgi:hypothetical protein